MYKRNCSFRMKI